MCRDQHQHFELFQDISGNSGWEIPSLPLDELCYHRQHSCLPQTQTGSYFVLYLDYSAIQPMLCSTVEYYHLDVKNVVSITPPLKNSWYSDTSHHHHSFLVPVLFLNEIPTNGLWCVNSKLLATLLPWSYWSIASFYVYGLMDHHSNIDCAT